MQIRFKISKRGLFAVCCLCVLGILILILKSINKRLPTNPCNSEGIDQSHIWRRRSTKYVTEREMSMLTGFGKGRLGNQMLCYATMFAIGHYNNRKVFMSPTMSDLILKYFKVSTYTMSQNLFDQTVWTDKAVGGVVDESIRNLTQPYVRLYGVPQSWKYFDEIRPLIRNQFQFYDEIVQMSKMKLKSIKDEFFPNYDQISVTMIGIHVRRGDYIYASKNVGFYVPGMKYYSGAMLYFEERYNNVIFVVASDDIQWCTANFAKLNEDYRIRLLECDNSGEMAGLDMATLTLCDHVIYGLGSFGFWAGYLNPGDVIFCSDCMTPTAYWLRHSNVYNGDYGNAVLPSWIGYSRNGIRTNRSVLARTDDVIAGQSASQQQRVNFIFDLCPKFFLFTSVHTFAYLRIHGPLVNFNYR